MACDLSVTGFDFFYGGAYRYHSERYPENTAIFETSKASYVQYFRRF